MTTAVAGTLTLLETEGKHFFLANGREIPKISLSFFLNSSPFMICLHILDLSVTPEMFHRKCYLYDTH